MYIRSFISKFFILYHLWWMHWWVTPFIVRHNLLRMIPTNTYNSTYYKDSAKQLKSTRTLLCAKKGRGRKRFEPEEPEEIGIIESVERFFGEHLEREEKKKQQIELRDPEYFCPRSNITNLVKTAWDDSEKYNILGDSYRTPQSPKHLRVLGEAVLGPPYGFTYMLQEDAQLQWAVYKNKLKFPSVEASQFRAYSRGKGAQTQNTHCFDICLYTLYKTKLLNKFFKDFKGSTRPVDHALIQSFIEKLPKDEFDKYRDCFLSMKGYRAAIRALSQIIHIGLTAEQIAKWEKLITTINVPFIRFVLMKMMGHKYPFCENGNEVNSESSPEDASLEELLGIELTEQFGVDYWEEKDSIDTYSCDWMFTNSIQKICKLSWEDPLPYFAIALKNLYRYETFMETGEVDMQGVEPLQGVSDEKNNHTKYEDALLNYHNTQGNNHAFNLTFAKKLLKEFKAFRRAEAALHLQRIYPVGKGGKRILNLERLLYYNTQCQVGKTLESWMFRDNEFILNRKFELKAKPYRIQKNGNDIELRVKEGGYEFILLMKDVADYIELAYKINKTDTMIVTIEEGWKTCEKKGGQHYIIMAKEDAIRLLEEKGKISNSIK